MMMLFTKECLYVCNNRICQLTNKTDNWKDA